MTSADGERLSSATTCRPSLSGAVHVSRFPPRLTSRHLRTESQRVRDTQTDRQTDRHRDTKTEKEETQRRRDAETQRHRDTETQTEGQRDREGTPF